MSSFYSTKGKTIKKNKGKKNKSREHIKLYMSPSTLPLIRTLENQVFTIVQTTAEYSLIQQPIVPTFLAFNFSLDQLPQYTSFTTLFDQYKFSEVQVIIRPQYNANPMQVSGTNKVPLLYTVIDYDDNATPSTIAQLEEYGNCQISEYETVSARFTPHMAIAAYDGSVFTSFANKTADWIDAAYPAVKHYGVKMGCGPGFTGQTLLQAYDVSVRYKIQFRNLH
jgi:hypothetical protein